MRIRQLLNSRAIAAVLGTAAIGMLAPAWAAGLSVAPTQIEFAATDSVRGLRLTNTGGALVNAQLRVFAWSQEDGEDVLTPSTALVVSPPMLRIAPGQQQFVRIVRIVRLAGPAAANAQREQTYRVLVDELPQAVIDTVAPRSGLNFVMRYSVPVFIAPDAPPVATSPLAWSLQRDAEGRALLHADNPTSRRAQLAELQLLDAAGRAILTRPGLLGYVLAGTGRHWPLNLPADSLAAATEIQVRVNGETLRQPLSTAPLGRAPR